MGDGIDLAALDNPEHAAMIDNFKDQLLVAMVVKYGPEVNILVSEVDATGDYVLKMNINGGSFNFTAERKQ